MGAANQMRCHGHGVNRTDKPARLVMFVIGTAGQAYALRPPWPTDATLRHLS